MSELYSIYYPKLASQTDLIMIGEDSSGSIPKTSFPRLGSNKVLVSVGGLNMVLAFNHYRLSPIRFLTSGPEEIRATNSRRQSLNRFMQNWDGGARLGAKSGGVPRWDLAEVPICLGIVHLHGSRDINSYRIVNSAGRRRRRSCTCDAYKTIRPYVCLYELGGEGAK